MDYIRLRPTELPSAQQGSGWLRTTSLYWGRVGLARRGSVAHGLAWQSHGLPNVACLGSARPWFVERGPVWPGLAWLRFAPPTWLGLLSFSTKKGSELILTAVRLRRCAVLYRRVVLLYGVVKLLCFTQLLSFDLSWWKNDVVLFATIFQGEAPRLFVCDDLSQQRNNIFLFPMIFQGGGILIFASVRLFVLPLSCCKYLHYVKISKA